jgi:hypothetical protein
MEKIQPLFEKDLCSGTHTAILNSLSHHTGTAAQILCLIPCEGKLLEARGLLLEAVKLIREEANGRDSY